MRMTIDDCISKLTEILEEATEDENSVCYVTVSDESTLKKAISIMCKYQKIKETYNNWNVDFGVETHRAMSKIGEVLNDGNDNN